MWAYRGATIPLNVFDFRVSRHRDGPELFFADYKGTLVGDCWSGFQSIASASNGTILRAACNSHAGRKVRESLRLIPLPSGPEGNRTISIRTPKATTQNSRNLLVNTRVWGNSKPGRTRARITGADQSKTDLWLDFLGTHGVDEESVPLFTAEHGIVETMPWGQITETSILSNV